MSGKKTSLTVVSVAVILVASLAVIEFGIAQGQGQGNLTSLTPEQKNAICSSVGSHVNSTESKICGIPTTPASNTTSSENATTGPEAPTADSGEQN
jgi:hypothetical protein